LYKDSIQQSTVIKETSMSLTWGLPTAFAGTQVIESAVVQPKRIGKRQKLLGHVLYAEESMPTFLNFER